MLRNLSVIDPPFLLGLGLVTAVVFVASWLPVRRWWMRWGIRALGVVLTTAMAASAVNARYAYLPTLAAALGRSATDQISSARLHALELAAGQKTGDAGRSIGGRLAASLGSLDPHLEQGVAMAFKIPATMSHFHARTAEVYLPPAYFEPPYPRLPVIELLHGSPGSPVDWTRGGFADVTADEYASEHHGFAPILVLPDVNGAWTADSECVDGRRGNAQTYLTVDVRNAVIARFHARRDARGWAIAGLSEGAYCAVQIGLRHPTLYGAIGDFSGETGPSVGGGVRGLQRLFRGTRAQALRQAASYNPAQILRRWNGLVRPPIWFEVGTDDNTAPAMVQLDLLARAHGFETRFVAQPASTHTFGSWREAFHDALPWFASLLGIPALASAAGSELVPLVSHQGRKSDAVGPRAAGTRTAKTATPRA
jgi:enterochelin esterase-like enzyme